MWLPLAGRAVIARPSEKLKTGVCVAVFIVKAIFLIHTVPSVFGKWLGLFFFRVGGGTFDRGQRFGALKNPVELVVGRCAPAVAQQGAFFIFTLALQAVYLMGIR